MNTEDEERRSGIEPWVGVAFVASLLVVGSVIRVLYASQDLFADELSTYWIISTNGLGGVVETVYSTAEITPPLGFVLSWFATRIELTPELLRLPALIGGIGSIPLVYLIGKKTVGQSGAILAAALTTFSPFMIYYSAEARGYGLMMFLLLCSTLSMLLAVERGDRRWWVAYAAFTCATAYTHYTAIFVIAVQFAWVLWSHPQCRGAVTFAAAAAAVGFLPWASGLAGDLSSPTTEILSGLSPFNPGTIRTSLQHWALGFPYASAGGLRTLPGTPALALLAAALAIAAYSAWNTRDGLRERYAERRKALLLVALLAVATPLGAALASLVGSNVFGTRNLAASWPYAALLAAAVLTVGTRGQRFAAGALAVIAFAIAAATIFEDDFERPRYAEAASYIESGPAVAVVDSSALTPGPLTNLDVSLDSSVPDIRLNVPQEMSRPFEVGDPFPDPAAVADQAVEVADGGPIAISLGVDRELPPEFLDALPDDYRLVAERRFPALLDLRVLTYSREGPE